MKTLTRHNEKFQLLISLIKENLTPEKFLVWYHRKGKRKSRGKRSNGVFVVQSELHLSHNLAWSGAVLVMHTVTPLHVFYSTDS